MKTKIIAKYIIGFDTDDHTILEDAELVFEGEQILFVGEHYPGPVERIIDAGNALVSPGFIDLNALGDIDHDILHYQACPDVANGLIWSEAYFDNGPQDVLTEEEEIFNIRYAFTQLIRNGITTAMPITSVLPRAWTRTYAELVQAVHIAGELGLRVYLGPSYQSGARVVQPDGTWAVRWQPEKGIEGLNAAVEFVQKYDGAYEGLVKGFLAPERVETITPELLVESKRCSDMLNCHIRLHAAQGAFEYQEIQQRHGLTPIAFLDRIGFLGPKTLIPHAIFTSGSKYIPQAGDADLDLLAESGATVIHCPLIMARHGMALDTYERYRAAGVNLAMGTDTFPPDMIENIRWASILAKVVSNNASAGSAADFFRAATLFGARALQRQDLGRLAPGAKADLIIIDLDDFLVGQVDDPIKTLIYGASRVNIKTSIINGRIVMQDGQIPGVNEREYQERARDCFQKLKKGYTFRDYLGRSEDTLFPGSFRVISPQASKGGSHKHT